MSDRQTARRSMLAGIGAAAAGAWAIGSTTLGAQTPGPVFQPARHPQDAWFDQVPGRHRTFIDCSTARTAAEGLLAATNLYEANRTGYQLADKDVAVVVCLRHFATPFAYTDAVWMKYGEALARIIQLSGPNTPSTNQLKAPGYMGITLPSVAARGAQFAVCDMASHQISAAVAGQMKLDAQAVYKDFVSNLIPSSHLVAAGVVAVNRAQEYGYTLLTVVA